LHKNDNILVKEMCYKPQFKANHDL